MKYDIKDKRLSFRLSAELLEMAERMAEREKMPMGMFIRMLIVQEASK